MKTTSIRPHEALAAAILELPITADERAALRVRQLPESPGIECFCLGRAVFVGPRQLEAAERDLGWEMLARGTLIRLRNQHSLEPERIFGLKDLVGEEHRYALALFEALPQDLGEACREEVLRQTQGLEDTIAIQRAEAEAIRKYITRALDGAQTRRAKKNV